MGSTKKTFQETGEDLLILSSGQEISSELVFNSEDVQQEIADYYGWNLVSIAGGKLFWEFASQNNFENDSLEEFENYKFSFHRKPLRKLCDGRNLTDELILNDSDAQEELCYYYNWDYDELWDEGAFWHYVVNFHYTNCNEDTFEDFKEAYKGHYDSPKEFAEDFVNEVGDIPDNLPDYLRFAIDWEFVAKEFGYSDFWYSETGEGTSIFVYHNF